MTAIDRGTKFWGTKFKFPISGPWKPSHPRAPELAAIFPLTAEAARAQAMGLDLPGLQTLFPVMVPSEIRNSFFSLCSLALSLDNLTPT